MKYSWLFAFGILFVSCNHTNARRPINKNNTVSTYDYSIALNKTIQDKEQKKIKKYIAQDSSYTYTYSPYGFAYTKLKKEDGLGKKAVQESIVTYEKTIYNLKNELIYNTVEETIKIGKSKEIKGIEQGLKLMREYEEFKFIFSSFVAHGFSGDGHKIGANTPIVVKIKLLKIK